MWERDAPAFEQRASRVLVGPVRGAEERRITAFVDEVAARAVCKGNAVKQVVPDRVDALLAP